LSGNVGSGKGVSPAEAWGASERERSSGGMHSSSSSMGDEHEVGAGRDVIFGEEAETQRVRVTVRVRPRLADEDEETEVLSTESDGDWGRVTLQRPKGAIVDQSSFLFDRVLGTQSTQREVYDCVARDVVADVMQGFNGTILAYGQTGAGKTYTLSDIEEGSVGVIPTAVAEVCGGAEAERRQGSGVEYTVHMSYFQIYREAIQDLLRPDSTNLAIRESGRHGVFVEGVEEVQVGALRDCLALLQLGERNRSFAFTKLNAHSSRSHAIVILTVRRHDLGLTENGDVAGHANGAIRRMRVGKLFLVDLAGSERLKKSGSVGERASEARSINQSLTVLGMCIKARASEGPGVHVPFRDSKLTRLLQESLGGNARTSLVINVSPCGSSADETLGSLQFGSRAMKVQTSAVVNVEEVNDEDDYGGMLQRTLFDSRAEVLGSAKSDVSRLRVELLSTTEQLEVERASVVAMGQEAQTLRAEVKALSDARAKADKALVVAKRALESSAAQIETGSRAMEQSRAREIEMAKKLEDKEQEVAALADELYALTVKLREHGIDVAEDKAASVIQKKWRERAARNQTAKLIRRMAVAEKMQNQNTLRDITSGTHLIRALTNDLLSCMDDIEGFFVDKESETFETFQATASKKRQPGCFG